MMRDQVAAHTIPMSDEAEQALLAALLYNNRTFGAVSELLRPEHFVRPLHGRMFEMIARMMDNGEVADAVAIRRYIGADPDYHAAGGDTYLASIANGIVTLDTKHYGKIIRDLYVRRRLIDAANEIIAEAAIDDIDRSTDERLAHAEQLLFEIAEREDGGSGAVTSAASVEEALRQIEDAYRRQGRSNGPPTGLVDLDFQLSGGMNPSDLIIVAGRPAMGKTALAGSMAMASLKAGKRVAFFSLEMTHDQLTKRFLAALTGVSVDRQRRGDVDQNDVDRLLSAGRTVASWPIVHFDRGRVSTTFIRNNARRMKRRGGLDLIIVDHLQLIKQAGRQENRRLEIGDASGAMKALAKELQVPVVLLSQLSRAVEQREDKRPNLSDLRESGDIEQDADVVMFCYREEYYRQQEEPQRRVGEDQSKFNTRRADWEDACAACAGLADIIVAKNRHGTPGTIKARFDGDRSRFENLARQ